MKKPAAILPVIIIVNACMWGFTILMVAHTLKGNGAHEAYEQIQHILGAAAGMSTVIVGGGMVGLVASLKAKGNEPEGA